MGELTALCSCVRTTSLPHGSTNTRTIAVLVRLPVQAPRHANIAWFADEAEMDADPVRAALFAPSTETPTSGFREFRDAGQGDVRVMQNPAGGYVVLSRLSAGRTGRVYSHFCELFKVVNCVP